MSNANLHDTIVSFLTEKFPEIHIDMTTPVVSFVNSDSPGPLQFYIDGFVSMLEDALNATMPDSVFDDLVLAAPVGQPLTLGQAMPHLVQMTSGAVNSPSEPVVSVDEPSASFEDTQIDDRVIELVLEQPVVEVTAPVEPVLAAWPFLSDTEDEEIDINLSEESSAAPSTASAAWPFPVGQEAQAPVYVLSDPVEQAQETTDQPEVAAPVVSLTESVAPVEADSSEQAPEEDDFEVNDHAIRAAYKYALKHDMEAVLVVLDAIFLESSSSAKKVTKLVKKSLKSIKKGAVAPFESVNSFTLAVPELDEPIYVNLDASDAAFKYSLKYELDAVLEVLEAIFIDTDLSKKKSKKVVRQALKTLR